MVEKEIIDSLNRPLRDLRISVTDRCNFRCRYCMPAEVFGAGYQFLPKDEILRFGEIEQLARMLVAGGVEKLRLTGGEPLLRRDLADLVAKLAGIDGVLDIAMTTNGALLAKYAEDLKLAGLHRVTVSIDALDEQIFAEMNGVGAKPDRVIEGIDKALEVGLGVKLNTVVKKGVNEQEVLPLVQFAKERNIPVRFIEFMDTGNTNQWKLDEVVPSAQLLESIRSEVDLVALPAKRLGETAIRYGLENFEGFEVGFISSVTKPFCSSCNRMRLSADGKLFSCLFASDGLDIKEMLRAGKLDELDREVNAFWNNRKDRYSELRSDGVIREKAEMSYLGG